MPATKSTTMKSKTANVWTDEERAAMQASAKERKSAARRDPAEERAEGEAEVRAKLADMPAADLTAAVEARITALVKQAAS